jgi:hypothetical protein
MDKQIKDDKYNFSIISSKTLKDYLESINDSENFLIHQERGKDWISFGTRNNDYLLYELDLYRNSGFHKSIINTKVNMIVGDEFDQVGEWSERTESFLNNVNPYENMRELFYKLSLDFEVCGMSYIKIVWSRDGKYISNLYHTDATKILWEKKDDNGNINGYYYSNDWKNTRKDENKPVYYPIYNPDNVIKIKDDRKVIVEPIQIFPIIKYDIGMDYYTLQSYMSSSNWIEMDIEIGKFHLQNLKNGFAPMLWVDFPQDPPGDDERKSIENKIISKFSGTEGQKLITTYHPAGDENKPEITIFPTSDLDKQYKELNENVLQHILSSHQVTNENLVGISTPGKLSNDNEYISSYKIYLSSVVKKEQEILLASLNKILSYNGMNDIRITNNIPIDKDLGENVLKEILTINELRDLAGFSKEPDENEYVDYSGCEVDYDGKKYTMSSEHINRKFGMPSGKDNILYIWKTNNNDKACPICKSFNNQIKTLKEWKDTAIPGLKAPNGIYNNGYDYGTYCTDKCKCSLVKIN